MWCLLSWIPVYSCPEVFLLILSDFKGHCVPLRFLIFLIAFLTLSCDTTRVQLFRSRQVTHGDFLRWSFFFCYRTLWIKRIPESNNGIQTLQKYAAFILTDNRNAPKCLTHNHSSLYQNFIH